MNAVAAGLVVMVFSSYIMWYQLKPKTSRGHHRVASWLRELHSLPGWVSLARLNTLRQ
jgi:hypothetical protein